MNTRKMSHIRLYELNGKPTTGYLEVTTETAQKIYEFMRKQNEAIKNTDKGTQPSLGDSSEGYPD